MRVNQTIEFSFKIIHLKSKTNREENFGTSEELQDLAKNSSTATNRSEKKRARTMLGRKSAEQSDSATGKRSRAKAKFLLRR